MDKPWFTRVKMDKPWFTRVKMVDVQILPIIPERMGVATLLLGRPWRTTGSMNGSALVDVRSTTSTPIYRPGGLKQLAKSITFFS
jgi:hypothetical protein